MGTFPKFRLSKLPGIDRFGSLRIETTHRLRVGYPSGEHLAVGWVHVTRGPALEHEIGWAVGVVEAERVPEFVLDGVESHGRPTGAAASWRVRVQLDPVTGEARVAAIAAFRVVLP